MMISDAEILDKAREYAIEKIVNGNKEQRYDELYDAYISGAKMILNLNHL